MSDSNIRNRVAIYLTLHRPVHVALDELTAGVTDDF